MSVSILDREIYSEREAARVLRLPQSTLHYWLEGGERRGRIYAPIIRLEPTGSKSVTWAEFVEAGLLRRYRREHKIPMTEMREVIDSLRRETGAPYPLAHETPFVASGRQLMNRIQDDVGLDPEFCLISIVRGQLMLTPASDEFYKRVYWQEGVAAAWRPDDDLQSTVRVLPDQRFGRPNVAGISTEVLWEHNEAGEDVESIADAFDLSERDVRWAIAYENSVRAAA